MMFQTTAGPITSNDNKVYIITHDNIVLEKGTTYKLIFMVKYDKNSEIPMLETIHFNGRRICPPDLGMFCNLVLPIPTISMKMNPFIFDYSQSFYRRRKRLFYE